MARVGIAFLLGGRGGPESRHTETPGGQTWCRSAAIGAGAGYRSSAFRGLLTAWSCIPAIRGSMQSQRRQSLTCLRCTAAQPLCSGWRPGGTATLLELPLGIEWSTPVGRSFHSSVVVGRPSVIGRAWSGDQRTARTCLKMPFNPARRVNGHFRMIHAAAAAF